MPELEIRNFTRTNIAPSFFEKIVGQVLKRRRIAGNASIELVFVGERRMQTLNSRYRGKNRATDVLSFGRDKFSEKFRDISGLGEIVICPNIVARQAKVFGNSFRMELGRVFIHGLLHLLGYEHENDAGKADAMRKKEKEIIQSLKNKF